MLKVVSAWDMMGFALKFWQKMCRTKFKVACTDVKKDRDWIFLCDGKTVNDIGKDRCNHIMAHVLSQPPYGRNVFGKRMY